MSSELHLVGVFVSDTLLYFGTFGSIVATCCCVSGNSLDGPEVVMSFADGTFGVIGDGDERP